MSFVTKVGIYHEIAFIECPFDEDRVKDAAIATNIEFGDIHESSVCFVVDSFRAMIDKGGFTILVYFPDYGSKMRDMVPEMCCALLRKLGVEVTNGTVDNITRHAW